jgi:DNA-binding beta-propeller fold protein YncE
METGQSFPSCVDHSNGLGFAGAFLLAANLRGEFVYVANDDGTISGYTVGTNGNLTSITGSPFTAGGNPSTVAVHTTGGFLYAALDQPGKVAGFSIGANGALAPVAGSPFRTGHEAFNITVDPSGKFTYVCNGVEPYRAIISSQPEHLGRSPGTHSPSSLDPLLLP